MSIPEQQPNEVFFKITFLFIAPWFLNEYYRLTRNYGKKKAIKILNGVLVNDYFKIYNCKDLPFKNCDDLVGFVLLKTQIIAKLVAGLKYIGKFIRNNNRIPLSAKVSLPASHK